MAVSTSTLLTQTFTGQSGDWSSSVIDAGAYTELIFDFQLTSLDSTGNIALNRINPLGTSFEIWSANLNSETTFPYATDIGPCDGYAVSHAFGDQIQVVLTTTGTYSGSLCIQGKG